MEPTGCNPTRAITWIAVGVLCLIWGSTWLVIREGLRDLPPFSSAALRFGIAAAVMIALAPVIARREGGAAPPRWLWISSSLANFSVPYGIVYWCEQTLPSGLVSLLWSVFPMLVAISGHFFLKERLGARQWLGFVAGLWGMAFLFGTDLRGMGAAAVATGALLMLSPLAATVGTTLVKRHGEKTSSALLNRNAMTFAALQLGAVALATEHGAALRWTPRAWFSLGYLSIIGTVATFGLYFWLLRYAPAYRLSLIAYVTPALALLLGWAVGQEPITIHTLVGAAMVVAGIALVVARRRRKEPRPGTS